MTDFFAVYIYFGLALAQTILVVALTALFPSHKSAKGKFTPYESGIATKTQLLEKRFSLHHYLVALVFLVFDIEIIFLYPWAVVAKELGPIAFYEILFFLIALSVGFAYVWRKGGLKWE